MDTHDRLEETNKRAIEIYTHIGYMSTHFAGLELTVLKLLAKIIKPNGPDSALPSVSIYALIGATL